MKYAKTIMFALWAIFLFVALPLSTEAQTGDIAVGDKVKVHAPAYDDRRVIGWVEQITSSGILISSGNQRITVPFNTIQDIQVSRGQKSRWRLGFALGIIPGAIGGALATKSRCNIEEDPCFMDLTDLENALIVSTGVLVGMTIGSLIGSTLKTDRWQRISLGLNFHQTNIPGESYTLSPSVSFRIPLSRRR